MTVRFGSKPAHAHRAENLQLILNRDHPDHQDVPPPAPWLLALREQLLREQASMTARRLEAQRAQIRERRMQVLKEKAEAQRTRIAADAAIAVCDFALKQLEIEDQLLDTPR